MAGLFAAGFSRLLGTWKGMLAAFLGIALHVVLAGASAGVTRAAVTAAIRVLTALPDLGAESERLWVALERK